MHILERATSLLLRPKPTWQAIDAQAASAAGLYTGYLMVLAAIPAVCGFIGFSLIGMVGVGVSYRLPLWVGLATMLVSYVLTLAGVYLVSRVISALAPVFGGVASRIQALKVAVYSSTAALLAGAFNLVPTLSMLGVLAGLYSLYLLHTGLPVLMKSSRGPAIAYTACVAAAAMVLALLLGAVNTGLALSLAPRGDALLSRLSSKAEPPVDGAAIAAAQHSVATAARQMETATAPPGSTSGAAVQADANRADGTDDPAAAAPTLMLGRASPVDVEVLQSALPEHLGGLASTSVDTQSGSTLGVSASQVRADYGTGERKIVLEISDLGGLGAVAAAALSMVQGETEDAEQVEKTWQENGRSLHERYRKDGSSAERRVALDNGIIVTFSAHGSDIASLRSMATHIDLAALEQLERPAP